MDISLFVAVVYTECALIKAIYATTEDQDHG